MLKTLYIKDYALIEKISVEFGEGLNIILGETGAGKSILIGALGLLVGDRASSEVIRGGAKKSIIEGVFDISHLPKIKEYLDKIDIDFEDELIVRREISVKGSNRIFLNDTPVTLLDIKTLGEMLVDMHGQHSHQSLLKAEKHVEFLDKLGDYSDLLAEFKDVITEAENVEAELNALKKREKELREKLELYEFKLSEIDEVAPEAGEDARLEAELKILENAEYLFNSSREIYEALYESEDAVYDKLSAVERKLSELARYDENFRAHAEDAINILSAISEIAEFTRNYKDNLELDPEMLEEKRERLGALNLLKKKYGGTLENVIEFRNEIANELNLAQNFSFEIERLEKEVASLRKEAGEIAAQISQKRKLTAQAFEPKIEKVLKTLGMNDAKFKVKISVQETASPDYVLINGKRYAYNKFGIDEVEFLISPNAGEELKPLVKIASGGEISRVMLALKTLLAEKDAIPVLIFDEIDTGISGRIAQKTGEAMRRLSETHQIIAITHLPQIAAFARNLFVIEKQKENERAVSKIRKTKQEEFPHEIAKLIGGETITETALKSAEELLSYSENL